MVQHQDHLEIEALQRLYDAGLDLQFLPDTSSGFQRTHLILAGNHHPVYEGAYRINPVTSLYVKETNRLQFPHYHLIPGRAGVRLSLVHPENPTMGTEGVTLLEEKSEVDSPLQLGPRTLLQIEDGKNLYAYSIYGRWTPRFFEEMSGYQQPIDTSHVDFQRRT